jgi:hypothetical protein
VVRTGLVSRLEDGAVCGGCATGGGCELVVGEWPFGRALGTPFLGAWLELGPELALEPGSEVEWDDQNVVEDMARVVGERKLYDSWEFGRSRKGECDRFNG